MDLRVDQSGDLELAFGRMREAARRLREEDADDATGMPVIDPCHAAAEAALAALDADAAR